MYKVANKIIEKLSISLNNDHIDSQIINKVTTTLELILNEYRIFKILTTDSKPLKSYRVRYKYIDEKGNWVSAVENVGAATGGDSKEYIKNKYPNCKVTSAWWIR